MGTSLSFIFCCIESRLKPTLLHTCKPPKKKRGHPDYLGETRYLREIRPITRARPVSRVRQSGELSRNGNRISILRSSLFTAFLVLVFHESRPTFVSYCLRLSYIYTYVLHHKPPHRTYLRFWADLHVTVTSHNLHITDTLVVPHPRPKYDVGGRELSRESSPRQAFFGAASLTKLLPV